MAQASIAWAALFERLAQAGLTITNRQPLSGTPSTGWWVRLLDDGPGWDGPYSEPLDAVAQAVQTLLSAYEDTLRDTDDALHWNAPPLLIGDTVSIDGVRGHWVVTHILENPYVRVRERLKGTAIDVDSTLCIKDDPEPPRVSTA